MGRSPYKVGQKIRIIDMDEEPNQKGKVGIITRIDDMCQLHGTWSGLAVLPGWDKFDIIDDQEEKVNE